MVVFWYLFRFISQHKEIPCLFLTPSRNYRAFFIFLDKRQITKFVKCINTKFQTSVEFQKSCMSRIAWFYKIWLSISWSLGKSHMSKFTILQVTIKLLQWSDEILTIARCPGVWDPNYNIGHTTVPCSCKMVKLKHE